MQTIVLFVVLLIGACASDPGDTPQNVLDPDLGNKDSALDVQEDDVFDIDDAELPNAVWTIPHPRFESRSYALMAERLCVVGGDRSKKVFSLQLDAYHLGGNALAWRNGEGYYLFVNETCEAWMQFGDSYLEMPAYKQLTVEQFATLLENFRVLEFDYFGRLGFTRLRQANFFYFEVDGRRVALGVDYLHDYVEWSTGEPQEWAKDLLLADYELLAIAILRYRFWEDSELLAGSAPYRGERLWFTVSPQTPPNIFPARLVQDWPFAVGPEEMGVVTLQGCSDFWHVSGEEADRFRELRDTMLAMEPKDSDGHWTVPMRWGEKTYWVDMAEGFPLEDEDGYIPFMGIRMRYVDCSEE